MALCSRTIFVQGLMIDAAIGVYDHEHGRTQPLIIDAELSLSLHEIHSLKDTLNYELVGRIARDLVAKGHITLVETLAEALGEALLALPFVYRVVLSLSKPEALGDAKAAGVRVCFETHKD